MNVVVRSTDGVVSLLVDEIGDVVDVAGSAYPAYRLMLIGVGLLLALVVWLVVERTSVGALRLATWSRRSTAGSRKASTPPT